MKATIIFSDGSEEPCAYDKALRIKSVLDGKTEAKNKEQEDFISKIANVRLLDDDEYDSRTGRREKHKSIMGDKSLSGYDKFIATKKLYTHSI